jgi:two-component system, NtrC family, response regulator PilR
MLRTLVVDDEPSIRHIVRSLLESAGHQVSTASSGREALALLEKAGSLDLMVVDISLGDLSGLEVIRASRKARPSLHFIVMSGYIGLDSVELRRALRRDGVLQALSKPFTAQEFLKAVREVMMEELPPA